MKEISIFLGTVLTCRRFCSPLMTMFWELCASLRKKQEMDRNRYFNRRLNYSSIMPDGALYCCLISLALTCLIFYGKGPHRHADTSVDIYVQGVRVICRSCNAEQRNSRCFPNVTVSVISLISSFQCSNTCNGPIILNKLRFWFFLFYQTSRIAVVRRRNDSF